uniref:Predicted protein n=1 Tax=Physcomitrium patens TaxID=3218 RepID=A9U8A6_PHYPA
MASLAASGRHRPSVSLRNASGILAWHPAAFLAAVAAALLAGARRRRRHQAAGRDGRSCGMAAESVCIPGRMSIGACLRGFDADRHEAADWLRTLRTVCFRRIPFVICT